MPQPSREKKCTKLRTCGKNAQNPFQKTHPLPSFVPPHPPTLTQAHARCLGPPRLEWPRTPHKWANGRTLTLQRFFRTPGGGGPALIHHLLPSGGGGSGEPTFGVPILDPKKTIWRFTPKIEETPSSGRVPTQPDLPPPQRRGLGRDQPPPFGSQHLRKFLLP